MLNAEPYLCTGMPRRSLSRSLSKQYAAMMFLQLQSMTGMCAPPRQYFILRCMDGACCPACHICPQASRSAISSSGYSSQQWYIGVSPAEALLPVCSSGVCTCRPFVYRDAVRVTQEACVLLEPYCRLPVKRHLCTQALCVPDTAGVAEEAAAQGRRRRGSAVRVPHRAPGRLQHALRHHAQARRPVHCRREAAEPVHHCGGEAQSSCVCLQDAKMRANSK